MALIHSILIGAVGGMRAMTPLAAVANAARLGRLPLDNGAPSWLSSQPAAMGASALAAAEMAGDKMKSAPDRIVAAGLLARLATGAVAGAALAPARQRGWGALLGATAATGAAFITFKLRMSAMKRYGQTRTGAIEDSITAASAALIVCSARRRAPSRWRGPRRRY